MDPGVKDTAAFRVIRQVVDHTWSADEKLDDGEVVRICQDFRRLGGSWKELMAGDVRQFEILEGVIGSLFDSRALSKIARKLAGESCSR